MHKFIALLKTSEPLKSIELWHGVGIQFLWNGLLQGGCVKHDNQQKPFCWNVEAKGLDTAVLTFTSIVEDITSYAIKKAQEARDGKAYLPLAGNINVLVQEVYPIVDVPYLHNSVSLKTISGMICRTGKVKIYGQSKPRRYLTTRDNGKEWKENIIGSLVRKTNMFLGTAYKKEDVSIDHIQCNGFRRTAYHNHKYGCEIVSFVLRGPDEVLQAAIYGGIGSKNPSGFGMVAFY